MIFYFGQVETGGSTSCYSVDKAITPGETVNRVLSSYRTIKIGFFNKVLRVVDDWEGQQCGIQLNIKDYVQNILSNLVHSMMIRTDLPYIARFIL